MAHLLGRYEGIILKPPHLPVLRVGEEENIAELSPYDKYKQISRCIRL